MVGQQGAAAPVPFGGFAAGAEGPVVGAGAGQVEVELDARSRGLLAARQGERIHVVGGGLGVGIGLVVAATCQANEFAPGGDGLCFGRHQQGVALFAGVGALGATAALAGLALCVRVWLGVGVWAVACCVCRNGRGFDLCRGVGRQPEPHGRYLRRLHEQCAVVFTAQGCLYRGFEWHGGRTQAGQRWALRQVCLHQRGVAAAQAGKALQGAAAGGAVVGNPVARGFKHGGQGRQPQIKVVVECALVEHADFGRQRQHLGVEATLCAALVAASHALQKAARAAMARSRRRRDAHCRVAATRTVEQGDAALHVGQQHALGVRRRGCDAGDGLVPPLAYPFFHEPKSGSWMRPTGPLSARQARRDDAARSCVRKEEQRRMAWREGCWWGHSAAQHQDDLHRSD